MSDLLMGYDMLVSITQNETNSQFQRLFGNYIQDFIAGNGITPSGGAFGGGGEVLKSYLRGKITAPTVQYATTDNPEEVLFSFAFTTKAIANDIFSNLGGVLKSNVHTINFRLRRMILTPKRKKRQRQR